MTYKICDPVHGFIRFTDNEKAFIDSIAFQRLRYIHQMGCAYLIYPGATHSRFEHSLGVMELATRIFDTLTKRVDKSPQELAHWRGVLRLAALAHDLGHLPFSHTAEKALLPGGGHERMTVSIVQSEPMQGVLGSKLKDVLKLAVSEQELKELGLSLSLSPWERVLSQIITDDNFGADRVDYLIRDATYTGVGYGHFDYHQLIDTLHILGEEGGPLTIGVSESGIQSIESLWIARYLMYARVYHLPKARVLAKHLSRFMSSYYNQVGFPKDLNCYLAQTDYTLMYHLANEAERGNIDALCLLKRVPCFKEISLSPKTDLEKLQHTFKESVFIDKVPSKISERLFPVLLDNGEIVSSTEASSFLRDIPLGGKPVSVFVAPKRLVEVQKWIESV